jgi:hypothetical protein
LIDAKVKSFVNKIFQFAVDRPYSLLVFYLILAIVVSFQNYLLPQKMMGGGLHTEYNNYLIFKQSFFHLLHGQDLYQAYPSEHWDLYKYSPTFSVFFALFALLPDILGLVLWNCLNVGVLFWGIRLLPDLSLTQTTKIFLFVVAELLTALQNTQSNIMMAGLLIGCIGLMERKNYFAAIMCLMATIFIKIFGVIGLSLLLFYSFKKKMMAYGMVAFIVFFLVPLIIVSGPQLIKLYESWWNLLIHDGDVPNCLSITCWIKSWFGYEADKKMVLMLAFIPLAVPFFLVKRYTSYAYRINVLCATLLWMVIFNHKAESPGFIIAVCGVAVWYFSRPRGTVDLILIVFVFIFTTLAPTDLFPSFIREEYFKPFRIKLVPCLLLWIRILIETLTWPKAMKGNDDTLLLPSDLSI